jgi:hypothetical protein
MDLNEAKNNIETAKRIIGRETEDQGSIWFGISKSMVGIAEWAIDETARLGAALAHSERMSFDRNEARSVEVEKLRRELDATKRELALTQGACTRHAGEAYAMRRERDDAMGFSSRYLDEAKAIREERDQLMLKLETQTKLAVGFQEAIDRLTHEQVERMKALREGKLVERLGQVIRDMPPFKERHTWIEVSDVVCAVLAELAQMPVDLPSAADIWTAWQSARNMESNTGAVVRMLQHRLAPILAARKIAASSISDDALIAEVAQRISDACGGHVLTDPVRLAAKSIVELVRCSTKIELPTWDDIKDDMGVNGFGSVERVAVEQALRIVRERLNQIEQKPTTFAESVAICNDIKSMAQAIDNEEKLRRAISTARAVHDSMQDPVDGTVVILGSLIAAVELLAAKAESSAIKAPHGEHDQPIARAYGVNGPSLWVRFCDELHANSERVSDRPLTMTDLRTLIRLIDR